MITINVYNRSLLRSALRPAYSQLAAFSYPINATYPYVCTCKAPFRGGILMQLCVFIMFSRSDRLLEHCSIALVGKYTKFSDSYASVIKALEHSALAISHKLDVKVHA